MVGYDTLLYINLIDAPFYLEIPMSENEKKNNTKKSPGKSEFEDFEEAFFNEGEFQVQEAKTGNYMAEDFGTDLWLSCNKHVVFLQFDEVDACPHRSSKKLRAY